MLTFLKRFFALPIAEGGIARLYRAILLQSRLPAFYTDLGVADTVDGRFDLLLLHILVVMQRLRSETEGANKQQELFDLMFADMDVNLREMGVGDMSVGKKIKPMVAAFYGRGKSYEAALAETGDEALLEALARNLYRNSAATKTQMTQMAVYTRCLWADLQQQAINQLLTGSIKFSPIPQALAA